MTGIYLTGQYDPSLVILSYLVASLAAYSAIDLAHRIHENPTRQWLWLVLGAFAMGTGVWSMHFIGMQAFELSIPLGYDLAKTLASLMAAVLVAALALYVASRATMGPSAIVIGAVLMGLGICVMHYTGMAAMEMQPGIQYDPLLFGASVVIAVAASGAALWIVFNLRRISRNRQSLARLAAAAIMGMAVVGMHYTGMAAANFPVGSICKATDSLTGAWTAGPVTVFTVALSLLIMWLAGQDARLQRRAAEERRRRLEDERTRSLALSDALTGLRNRAAYQQEVVNFMHQSNRSGRSFDLYYCVLNLVGATNPGQLDHAVLTLAQRLRQLSRHGDCLARYNRSEFVLLRTPAGVGDDPAAVRDQLLQACLLPVVVDGVQLQVRVHLGTAQYPRDGASSRQLMTAAARSPTGIETPAITAGAASQTA